MTTGDTQPGPTQSSNSAHFPIGLMVVLVAALAVRLMAVGGALLGNFATKNVVYAMIARNLVRGQASFWLPRLDCLCDGQRGLHLLEVPLSAYLAGGLWGLLGDSLDVWGRVVSIGFSMAAILVLYDLVHRCHGRSAAVGAAAILALSPVAVLYGQCFMLEASVVFFSVTTIDALDRWLAGRRTIWLAVSIASFALLTLTKIYMLVLLLPIGYMLCKARSVGQAMPDRTANKENRALNNPNHHGPSVPLERKHAQDARGTRLLAMVLFIVAALPAMIWVGYVMRAASPGGCLAGQVFYSLADSAQAHRPPDPLLTQIDFYRQLFDDFAGVVLTPVAFMLPMIGLLDRAWRRWGFWLVAMGLLVAVMPRKFYEMNYYWTILLPPVAVVAGVGWSCLVQRLRLSRLAITMLFALFVLASLRYTAGPLLKLPEEDRAVLPAAQRVRELVVEDEPVVTMHGSGIDLLYYCDRTGWALEPDEPNLTDRLAECGRLGARYLVIVDVARHESPDHDGRLANMTLISKGEGFRIYEIPDDL